MSKIIELILDDTQLDQIGVYAIGLVKNPAIEENFKYFSKETPEKKFYMLNEEKHILYGPAMIPNKKISRYEENGDEYFVYFSEETIQKLSENFMNNFNQKNFSFEHENYVDGVTLIEQWLIDNPELDKSKSLGFSLPKGTWMMGVKVNNIELWEKIKNGIVQGFSIEAYMMEKIIKNSEDWEIIESLKKILNENQF